MERILPPQWCRTICGNVLTKGCLEGCAPERQARHFLPEMGKSINEIPPFPLEDYLWNLSAGELKAVNGFYMAKIVEALQGVAIEDKPEYDIDIKSLMEEEDFLAEAENLPIDDTPADDNIMLSGEGSGAEINQTAKVVNPPEG